MNDEVDKNYAGWIDSPLGGRVSTCWMIRSRGDNIDHWTNRSTILCTGEKIDLRNKHFEHSTPVNNMYDDCSIHGYILRLPRTRRGKNEVIFDYDEINPCPDCDRLWLMLELAK